MKLSKNENGLEKMEFSQKDDEKKLQEKYMEMQMLEQQIKQIQTQAQTVEQQLIELMGTSQSLDDFKDTKEGDKILVPISSGIFLKAELKDNKEFLVNVGANTVVSKDIESTKELMEKQISDMRDLHTKVNMELQKIALKVSTVEQELKELASKVQ